MSEVLSAHLEGILEGDQCHLANVITERSITNWDEFCNISKALEPCPRENHCSSWNK